MREYISGIKALKPMHPSVRIVITEPLVNLVAQVGATGDEIAEAALRSADDLTIKLEKSVNRKSFPINMDEKWPIV